MSRTRFKLFFRFLRFLYPYRKQWLAILALSTLAGLLDLVNPYLSKLVIDRAIANKDLRLFTILALAGGSVFIITALFDALRQFLSRYIKVKVGFDLNKKAYKKLQNFPLSYFKDKSTGEHLYKLSYDVDRVKDFITDIPPQGLSLFPRLLFALTIVFHLNWQMALFSLILTPFLYLPYYYFTRRMRKIWSTLIESYQDIFKNLDEVFSHMYLVKAFGKENASIHKHLKKLIANIRLGMKNIGLEIASSLVSGVLSKIIIGLITFYGIYQVINGQMSLGTFTAIMVYLAQLMGLQGQFGYFFQAIGLGMVSCERLAMVLDDNRRIIETKEASRTPFQNPQVSFKKVSFGYRPQEFILRDISFNIGAGRHIALVGPSGCGKSTILNLSLKLYEPWEGEIIVNGDIGIALQEPFLWNDSIENNIRYVK
ncbi:MAG TPA: ABC transporter ATP-binding protein [Candidatus Omnitrophota bacterium]|nr:ABC transporter ATP-binding protein [Candidatus Omnitrophota bacterium]